jgi:hypothetical protein
MWACIVAWMHWSRIDEFVIGLKSVEEFYPSSPLGVTVRTLANCPRRRFAGTIQILPNNPAWQ